MDVTPRRAVGWGLWLAVTAALTGLAFDFGAQAYDARYCGPDASDCDLGFFWGFPAAGATLLISLCAALIVLRRRRRG